MIALESIDWNEKYTDLNTKGHTMIRQALTASECGSLIDLYDHSGIYRNIINMQRYRFGKGEYKYFSYPLPALVEALRSQFYPALSMIANEWMQKLSLPNRFPATHAELIQQCHQRQQLRPTPLILRYEAGGFNTLHQDLYGEVYFPFQIVFMLNQVDREYTGGEFVLTEQIPRAQSRAQVLRPNAGDAVIITTNFRPIAGTRGYYRAAIKHGVSEVTGGMRQALGIIFHDAL